MKTFFMHFVLLILILWTNKIWKTVQIPPSLVSLSSKGFWYLFVKKPAKSAFLLDVFLALEDSGKSSLFDIFPWVLTKSLSFQKILSHFWRNIVDLGKKSPKNLSDIYGAFGKKFLEFSFFALSFYADVQKKTEPNHSFTNVLT